MRPPSRGHLGPGADDGEREAIVQDVCGEGNIMVVGWGSTKHIVKEAVERIKNPEIASVHFAWVYPLSESQLIPLRKAKHIIVVENNAMGQFSKLLNLHAVTVHHHILKSDGLSFFVDELSQRLEALLKEIS
jgi:2-oxoglutarate ferredoxin oxidoreductase subunit alpha